MAQTAVSWGLLGKEHHTKMWGLQVSEGQPPKNIAETIEAYRARFRSDLIGRWVSQLSFEPGPSDVWEFYVDGTGKRYEYSVSGDRISWFDWLPVAERTLKFQVTKEVEQQGADEITINDDEPVEWVTIAYDFKMMDYYGPRVAMFQVPEQETFKFWWTLDYLYYVGNPALASVEA